MALKSARQIEVELPLSTTEGCKVVERSGLCKAMVLPSSNVTETGAGQVRVVGRLSCVLSILRRFATYLRLNSPASSDNGNFWRHLSTEDNSIPTELLGKHLDKTVESNEIGVQDKLYCGEREYLSRRAS